MSPAVPRPAATVALLRDAADGLEVWLMRRKDGMAFAPGVHVFPGGAVEPSDHDPRLPWSGPIAGAAARLGVDDAVARALVSAAVRETFEECGVLLVRGEPPAVADAEPAREALLSGGLTWADLLLDHDLTLDAAPLVPWSRWITPEWSPRRFDAYFFAAATSERHAPRWIDGEADAAAWAGVGWAVAAHEAGELPMLPPTIATLRALAACPTAAAALAAGPERIETGDG